MCWLYDSVRSYGWLVSWLVGVDNANVLVFLYFDTKNGWHPLLFAASLGHVESVRQLLEYDAAVNLTSSVKYLYLYIYYL